MTVELISHTQNPQKVIAAAAKLCYSKSNACGIMAGLDEDSASKFIRKLGALGHASPIEHASFTFAIDGISRACLAQITRHRIASYSVQSQRYVDMTDFRYVIPPEIDNDETARAEFIYAMNECARNYLVLKRRLMADRTRELVEKYHMSEELAVKKAEKIANEDARFALPYGYDNECEKPSELLQSALLYACAVGNSRACHSDVQTGIQSSASSF